MTERIILNDDDVVSMDKDENLTYKPTSRVDEIKNEIMERFDDDYREWAREGITCQCLSVKGGGWLKGKVRIEVSFELEFTPDKTSASPSASSLNDLREQLDL
ncbi:KGK domain protein [Rivularia sp. PCC 7116]|uniref:KGK domain-containing protein n=1 Tax=Rivularia sp. PCC 7116 TaxID=373994 RepID=UPI00029F15CA|nr:KGK domain-containing protein [Rivularia sp. PCC 7116]AFY54402.1 KGK domain protein [Rivularia sp. PCC 7116]